MTMQHDHYVEVIRRNGGALLEAAQAAPKAKVRACPEWDMADLVWHIGEVHHFWASVAHGPITDPRTQYDEPQRPADDSLTEFAREQLAFLLRVLAQADPATEVWSWSPQKNVAFITRRMAHETVVHRWDAQDAAGIDATIDSALASDGVDEFLSFFLGDNDVAPGSVHLHATDAPGEWLVKFGAGAPEVTREHAKGDAAMRGAAANLDLALWDRVSLERIEIIGDITAVDRLRAIASRE
jgi:uncharacterized protein (TIGR03083 family)